MNCEYLLRSISWKFSSSGHEIIISYDDNIDISIFLNRNINIIIVRYKILIDILLLSLF